MLVEHSFISIIDGDAACSAAEHLLMAIGFEPMSLDRPRACQLRRGEIRSARAKRITDLAQLVRIEFDRGRVTFAASIDDQGKFRREKQVMQEILLGLAETVEIHIGRGGPIEKALARWAVVRTSVDEVHRRIRRRQMILVIILLAIIAATIGLTVYATVHG